MAFRRRGRPDPEAAERLLDAVAAGAIESRQARTPESRQGGGSEPDPLAQLLAAAAAPARPGELDGEDVAVAAFRAAHATAPAATPRMAGSRDARPATGTPTEPPAERRRWTAGAFGWIAVVVATLTAGVALAAEIPVLRPAGPPTGTPSADAGPSAVRTSVPPATTAPARAPTSTPAPPRPTPPAGPGQPGQTPPPHALAAQCRAFLNGGGPNGPDRRPPSAVLVRAAGGRDEVVDYCRRLLATAPESEADQPPRPPGGNPPTDPPGGPPGRNNGGDGSR